MRCGSVPAWRARPARWLLAALIAVAWAVAPMAALPAALAPALAAGPAAAPGDFPVRLLSFGPAVPLPGQLLRIVGTITDAGARTVRDVQVYLRVPGAPVTDRAGLATVAGSAAGDPAVDGPLDVDHYAQLGTLRPGGHSRFTVAVPVDDLGLTTSGVYPLTIEVRATAPDGSRIAVADIRTYLPWQIGAGVAAASTRIGTEWLVPLTTDAARISESVFVDGALASTLAPSGRLGEVLGLLARLPAPSAAVRAGAGTDPFGAGQPGTTVQVAIDPMLVAEVESMAGGYRVVDSSSPTATGRSAALADPPVATTAPTTPTTTARPTATIGSTAGTGTPAASAAATPGPQSTPNPRGSPGSPGPSARPGPGPASTTPTPTAPTTTAFTTTALQDADLPGVHTRAGRARAVAQAWLAELRQVVTGRTVFVLPWSDPDLGAVADPRTELGVTALTGTWARGLELVRALGAEPVPLVWPTLGTDTAAELQLAGHSGAAAVLLPTVALTGSGSPNAGSDAGAVLGAAPAGAPTRVLRADTGLDTALALADPLLARQDYLAQTALLAVGDTVATAAGRPPNHPVLAVLPRGWDPPLALTQLLQAPAPAPWLRRGPTLTAAAPVAEPTPPTVTLRRHLAVLARQHSGDPAAATPEVSGATRMALAALAGQTSSLGDLLAEPAAVRRGLRAQRLALASTELVGRSVRWHRLAGAVTQTVTGIRHGVVLALPSTVQLSSGTGRFPVIVTNTLDQAVRIRLEMSTANRTRLGVASVPVTTLPADQRSTLEVQVDTHTHGLVEVRAVLEDSAGNALDAPLSFAVHSNSYDTIGWVIIVGAGALLFGATAVRLGRRIWVHTHTARP